MARESNTLAPETLGPTVTIGEILVEIVATSVGDGFRQPLTLTGPFPSGAPAIFIDQCARAGGEAGMIGAVGDDDFGRVNIERLARDGVDVSAVAVHPHYPTGSAFVRYRHDGSRDFVFNIARSAAACIEWTPATEALVNRAGHLHVMGTAMAAASSWACIERAAGVIRQRGGTISLDPNFRKELLSQGDIRKRLDSLVAMADLLLPSGEELALIAGCGDETAAVASLLGRGVAEVVVKRGAHGASWFGRGEQPVHARAFRVDEIDPTGAGDCFGGAYVACRRQGMSPAQALEYANAAGARNVTRRGPMEGAGTREELDAFIVGTPRRSA